jgi:TetR/AcrR family transcriptional regulator
MLEDAFGDKEEAWRGSAPRTGIAQRLWEASRHEFSLRGYHGARVQAIAHGAGCNVALLYRHWSSKKALYLDLLRSIRREVGRHIMAALNEPSPTAQRVVGAYLDAFMCDPLGARILVREIIDGGPFLSQLDVSEPNLMQPARLAATAMTAPHGEGHLRPGLDPMVSVLTVAGLAALASAGHEASRHLLDLPLTSEEWRQHLYVVLLHGLIT